MVALNSRICTSENPLGIVRGYKWTSWGLDIKALDPDVRQRFETDARAIVEKYHNMSNVITLKDPRMATLMPWWRPMFTNPVCLIVYRHPIFVARGLYKNHIELSFGDWLQVRTRSARLQLSFAALTTILLLRSSGKTAPSTCFAAA